MKKNLKMKALAYAGFVVSALFTVATIISATLVPLVAPALVSVPFFALASVAYCLSIFGMHIASQMWKRAERMSGFSQDPTPIVAPAPVAPAPVAPTPVAPAPVAPALVAPTPVAPALVAPTPVAPTPVAPAPVAPALVAPVAPAVASSSAFTQLDECSRLASQQKDEIMRKLDEETILALVASVGEDYRAISFVFNDYTNRSAWIMANSQLTEEDLANFEVNISGYLGIMFDYEDKFGIDDDLLSKKLPIITAHLAGNRSQCLDSKIYKPEKIHQYNANNTYKQLDRLGVAVGYHDACVLKELAKIKITHYVLDKVHRENPSFFEQYLTPAAASTL